MVAERLTAVQVFFEKEPVESTTDVAGTYVVETAQPAGVGRKSEHVSGSVYVDCRCQLLAHGEIVHCCEMEDFHTAPTNCSNTFAKPHVRACDVSG